MRILVEPSDYRAYNMGDMAMLSVAVSRLAEVWPAAAVEVFSDEPEALRALCPSATPISIAGRELWLGDDFLPGRLTALAGRYSKSARLAREVPSWIRNSDPALVELLWRWKLRARPTALNDLNAFTQAIAGANLVVVAGMGGVTDVFPDFARGILEVMNLAIRRAKPVVMVGQGFGPLTDPMLLARARSILPRVDLIALREARASGPLLQSLGISSERVVTTGDDAIELAYRLRQDALADGLGVNLRISDYSELGKAQLEPLKEVLQRAAAAMHAPIVPVPISTLAAESDAGAIMRLLNGYPNAPSAEVKVTTPADVIGLVKKCRLVVTGSYHAGVFALASGVPTIGLAKSAYYMDKFNGLAVQFGKGCEVISLDDRAFPLKLKEAIERLWAIAVELRPGLLESAARQIALGHAVYRRIREIVEMRIGQPRGRAADSGARRYTRT